MLNIDDRRCQRNELAHKIADWLDDQGYMRNCLTCEHWRNDEICGKWNARPPAKIIVSGCPDHTDLIPF